MQIINPWIFYLIELLSNIRIILGILMMLTLFGLIYLIIAYAASFDYSWEDDNELKSVKLWIKRCAIVLTIMGLFEIIIPSKETIYQMVVANYVTYENVENASDIIKDSVDYIFEKLEGKEE